MKVYIKFDIEKTCRVILQELLDKLGVRYTMIGSGCIQFEEIVLPHIYDEFTRSLRKYNIHIVDNNKALVVQKIKNTIDHAVQSNTLPLIKMSSYLQDKIGMNYRALAKIFAEICHMSIEEYIIRYKIERAKEMLVNEFMTLTEIAYTLHYSSVAHLSNQFKKTTGFCPKDFREVISRKRSKAATNHVYR